MSDENLTKIADKNGKSQSAPYSIFDSNTATLMIQEGMTKRETFAIVAMSSILSGYSRRCVGGPLYRELATWSVGCADALLLELAKSAENISG